MSHTKGPWAVNEEAVIYQEETRQHIADVFCVYDDKVARGQFAFNAMLIAAAPDLLEACERAADTFRWYEKIHLDKGNTQKAERNRAEAESIEHAIKKAKGEG